MKAQDLKNSILQLAIQGKLVEQCEEEGTAKELLEKIEAEKKQLIKDGKIKKENKLPEITEDEMLFDIPESWEWSRISNIADMYTGNSIPKSIKENKYSKVKEGFDYIGTKDVGFDYTINYENGIKIPYKEEKFRNSFKHSILMCIEGGSAGRKIGILDKTVCFGNKLCSFNLIFGEPRFLYYYLQSPMFTQAFRDQMNGIIGGVSIMKLKSLIVPIPPLEEQKRIIAKIEELMPYVDKYDLAHSEVEELNKKFPEDMQKSILQYAIQGKLVEQREEDGTGEELYKQIQEEKKKLIKEGKIKKTNELPEITEDEIPFDIPESWKWVRLGDLIHLTSGQDMTPNKYNDISKGIPYLTGASNIHDGELLINRWTEEPRAIGLKGDVLLTCKGTVGKTVILEEDEVHIARQIMSIRTITVDAEFIQYFVKSYVSILKAKAKSMIPGIERKDVLEAPLPQPPLAEQKRIVEKIEEILPYTKQLVK